MIRVLIVEDEPPIARAVQQMIESVSDAFEVIGCENNGQAALLRVEEEPVDIVITDIRMPLMNGLELLERLIALHPNCLSVVLSGHQDFNYVQTALRLGAFDYILKPLAPDKLKNLLDRLEGAYLKKSLQSAATEPVAGAATGASANCRVLLACAGNWPLSPDDSMVPGSAFWRENNAEKILRLFLNKEDEVLVLQGKFSTEYIVVFKIMSLERVTQISQTFFAALNRLSALPKTLYLSTRPVAFWETGVQIRSMRSELYAEIKLCRSMFLTDEGLGDKEQGASFSDLPTNKAVEALCINDRSLLKAAIDESVDMAVSGEMAQLEFIQFLDAVISDQRLRSLSVSGLKQDLYDVVSNAVTTDGLKADLLQLTEYINTDDSKADRKNTISMIEQYLNENYSKSISNDMLSALFGFVPSYISKIFRAQTGLTPSEYLTKLRIEKAKELLDTREDLLIREISLLVGYNDQYYFSKAFKKITGLWPTQYQTEKRVNETKS